MCLNVHYYHLPMERFNDVGNMYDDYVIMA